MVTKVNKTFEMQIAQDANPNSIDYWALFMSN